MSKRGTPVIILTSAIVGALLALGYFFFSGGREKVDTVVRPEGITVKAPVTENDNNRSGAKRLPSVVIEETPEQMMARYGLNRVNEDPASIAHALARLTQGREIKMLELMLQNDILPGDVGKSLREVIEKGGYKLDAENPVTEIGEIVRNKKVRWALNLEGGSRVLVDMEKGENGKWRVSRISLPTVGSEKTNDPFVPEANDALGIIDGFMRATISQRFDVAKRFVDKNKVADATIAGICILFEEGQYNLRKKQPLRNMFTGADKMGFLAYIQSAETKGGNIGLTLEKDAQKQWLISDVALDSLLQDYANRFGDGEGLYMPLVKNPKGGDSLVLYFGFDEAVLTPRSMRQLEIVANMLKVDPGKKIEISGHTDDLGSDKYNQVLSEARAEAVRQALIGAGLTPEQVITKGFGKKRPRRVLMPDGTDQSADSIRRANRRAEIYLDF